MERKCYFVSHANDVKDLYVELKELHEINGHLNVDVMSGRLYQHEASGVTIQTSQIGPNGYLGAHRSGGTACIQVLAGSGVVGLVDNAGNTLCEIKLSVGDLITFEEDMPLHFYRAGTEGLTYTAISIPKSCREL